MYQDQRLFRSFLVVSTIYLELHKRFKMFKGTEKSESEGDRKQKPVFVIRDSHKR